MKSILLFLIIVTLPAFVCFADTEDPKRQAVGKELILQGVDPDQAKSVLADSRVLVDPRIIIKNLFFSSPKGTGKQPDVMNISSAQIERSKLFIKENADILAAVETRFGVSPRIVTAILLIESRLGTYPMTSNVASVYVNLAYMLDPEYLKDIQSRYAAEYPQFNDEETINRARRKAQWAAEQLAYLIHIANHLKIDPLSVSGSFAGAMGPAQFIPSSFWVFGLDADGDGLASPFNMVDAKFSMGNYLRNYGWREDAPDEEKRKAIWHYNHSTVYVNTVMMVYEKLK